MLRLVSLHFLQTSSSPTALAVTSGSMYLFVQAEQRSAAQEGPLSELLESASP